LKCGTEDVLTCHVVIFRDRGTGVSAIGHFDEFTKRVHFEKMACSFLEKIRAVKSGIWEEWDECMDEEGDGEWEYYDDSEEEGLQPEPSVLDPDAVYDLYVVGGYKDDAAKAEKLTQRFFKHLHDLQLRLKLGICCLGEPNTKQVSGKATPRISGVCLDIKTGDIYSATFNRTFTDFTQDIKDILACFPPLIKNRSSLKKMIASQEDRGYGKGQAVCV